MKVFQLIEYLSKFDEFYEVIIGEVNYELISPKNGFYLEEIGSVKNVVELSNNIVALMLEKTV